MVDAIPKEVLAELKETFQFFEKTKGDGFISNKFLGTALRSLGLNPAESKLKAICDETDEDGAGHIKMGTFLLLAYALQQANQDSEQELREAFRVYAREVAAPLSPQLKSSASVMGGGGGESFSVGSPVAYSNGGGGGGFGGNTSFAANNGSFFNPAMTPTKPTLVMSVDELRQALMTTGDVFDEADLDELLRELDLMPGDDVALDDIIRICALGGVEKAEQASLPRRRARTTINSATVRGGGYGNGQTPQTNRSRAMSQAGDLSPMDDALLASPTSDGDGGGMDLGEA